MTANISAIQDLPTEHHTFASLASRSASSQDGDNSVRETQSSAKDDRFEVDKIGLIKGVEDDCVALLELFCAKNSMRFQDFASCWKEKMFSHILSGRPKPAEFIEYAQELLKVVMSLFVSSEDLKRKVGALYMLYGIYMKLPLAARSLVLIRVTARGWADLQATRRRLKTDNHHDALFVADYLFHVGAFLFVAHEHEMGPDLRFVAVLEAQGKKDEDEEEESLLTEYLEDGGLQQLSTLHDKYEALKKELFQDADRRRLATLGPNQMPQMIARLKAAAEGTRPPPTPADGRPSAPAAPSILSQREQARARAYARYRRPAVPRGSRHLPGSDDEHEDDAPASPQSADGRARSRSPREGSEHSGRESRGGETESRERSPDDRPGRGGSPVRGRGGSVRGRGRTVRRRGKSARVNSARGRGRPVQGSGSPVRGSEGPVRGNGSRVSAVRGRGSPMRGRGNPVRGGGSRLTKRESSARGRGNTVRGRGRRARGGLDRGKEGSAKERESPMRRGGSPVRGRGHIRGRPVRGRQGAEAGSHGGEKRDQGEDSAVRRGKKDRGGRVKRSRGQPRKCV